MHFWLISLSKKVGPFFRPTPQNNKGYVHYIVRACTFVIAGRVDTDAVWPSCWKEKYKEV